MGHIDFISKSAFIDCLCLLTQSLCDHRRISVLRERLQTTADDIRQASGIQDTDYTINLLLDKAKYEERIQV